MVTGHNMQLFNQGFWQHTPAQPNFYHGAYGFKIVSRKRKERSSPGHLPAVKKTNPDKEMEDDVMNNLLRKMGLELFINSSE